MNNATAVDLIRDLLAENLRDLSDEDVIRVFQEIRGLHVDGKLGQVTLREAERPRMCAVKDRISGTRARWDHTTWNGKQFKGEPKNMLLTYCVGSALPGLTKAQTDSAFAEALGYWTEVCAVVFVPTLEATKANLLFKIGKIDGPSSTLAWQELPAGKDTPASQLNGLYDSGEPWVDSADPPAARIDAVRVICHETGHGIGLDHGPEGNLLAPYYDRQIRKPQSWDIAEAQLRYGPPVAAPAPDEPPVPTAPPNQEQVIITIGSAVKFVGSGQLTIQS